MQLGHMKKLVIVDGYNALQLCSAFMVLVCGGVLHNHVLINYEDIVRQ